MINRQLELGFGKVGPGLSLSKFTLGRRGRHGQANWWFERMRRIVDRAMEPVPAAPHEQICLSGIYRQAGEEVQPSEERQVCE